MVEYMTPMQEVLGSAQHFKLSAVLLPSLHCNIADLDVKPEGMSLLVVS